MDLENDECVAGLENGGQVVVGLETSWWVVGLETGWQVVGLWQGRLGMKLLHFGEAPVWAALALATCEGMRCGCSRGCIKTHISFKKALIPEGGSTPGFSAASLYSLINSTLSLRMGSNLGRPDATHSSSFNLASPTASELS